jgi:hypothetical protein
MSLVEEQNRMVVWGTDVLCKAPVALVVLLSAAPTWQRVAADECISLSRYVGHHKY